MNLIKTRQFARVLQQLVQATADLKLTADKYVNQLT
jgi:hypothetical protein